jgi:hypothetical protein
MKGANDERLKKKKRNGLRKWRFGRGGKGTEEKYKRPEVLSPSLPSKWIFLIALNPPRGRKRSP